MAAVRKACIQSHPTQIQMSSPIIMLTLTFHTWTPRHIDIINILPLWGCMYIWALQQMHERIHRQFIPTTASTNINSLNTYLYSIRIQCIPLSKPGTFSPLCYGPLAISWFYYITWCSGVTWEKEFGWVGNLMKKKRTAKATGQTIFSECLPSWRHIQ